MTSRPLPPEWSTALERMTDDWLAITGTASHSLVDWSAEFERMARETQRLKLAGDWVRGRGDLLFAANRSLDELVHSNILAWLLAPMARHRLGARFLTDLAAATWGLELASADAATIRREVVLESGRRRRIADLVVQAGPVTLVIENKVCSPEDEHQCQDLYDLWTDHVEQAGGSRDDVYFVLLAPHGGPPRTADTDEAKARWRPLAYAWVYEWLLRQVDEIPSLVAKSTAIQYLISLRPLVLKGHC